MLKQFSIVQDPQEVAQVVSTISKYPLVALDLETTGLDFMRSEIHGVALATADQEWYVTLGAEKALFPLLQDALKDTLVLGHNLAFDLHFLSKYGVRPPKIADTMIAQFLIDENQGLALKSLAGTKLGYHDLPDFKDMQKWVKWLMRDVTRLSDVSIYDMPLHTLGEYAARDVRLTYELWEKSQVELRKEEMWDIFWQTEMPFVYVLMDMESTGFYIDQSLLNELKLEFIAARDEALDIWKSATGDINPASPKQLAEYFYKDCGFEPTLFTKTGAPSTDVMALMRLRKQDKTGVVQALLDYRKYEKLLSTYVTGFEDNMIDGRLYGNFNQLGDAQGDGDRLPRTGRLSSSSPNLQNIPARGITGEKIRQLFSSPPGYKFIDIDYSQLELRLGAHYTRDPNMLKVFAEGQDPHQLTADLCNVERHVGKAQPLTAKVLTPEGWSTMGNIQPGDWVIGSDGKPKKVLKCFYQGLRPVYRVTFSDRYSVECDEEHLWAVEQHSKERQVMTTKELLEIGVSKGSGKKKDYRFAVPLVSPVEYTDKSLPIDPYVLGVLLGDGGLSSNMVRVTIPNNDVLTKFKSLLPEQCTLSYRGKHDYYIKGNGPLGRGYHNPIVKVIKDLGLFGCKSRCKFIPDVYLLGSVSQRKELLQGLLDTDGYVSKTGVIQFSSTSEKLTDGVVELVQSLGGIAYKTSKNATYKGKDYGKTYTVTITITTFNPLYTASKADRVKTRESKRTRRITSIEYIGEKETKCILVDSDDHLYVTDHFVVTHNTANFLVFYGGGPYKFADTLEKSGYDRPDIKDTREWLKRFDEAYPTIQNWKNQVITYARQLGYVRTIGGRRRRLSEITSKDNALRGYAERAAVNSIIQGSAADIVKWAMLEIYKIQGKYNAQMLAQVHDEVAFLAPEDTAEEFGKAASEIMQAAGDHFKLRVKLEANPGVGDNWFLTH